MGAVLVNEVIAKVPADVQGHFPVRRGGDLLPVCHHFSGVAVFVPHAEQQPVSARRKDLPPCQFDRRFTDFRIVDRPFAVAFRQRFFGGRGGRCAVFQSLVYPLCRERRAQRIGRHPCAVHVGSLVQKQPVRLFQHGFYARRFQVFCKARHIGGSAQRLLDAPAQAGLLGGIVCQTRADSRIGKGIRVRKAVVAHSAPRARQPITHMFAANRRRNVQLLRHSDKLPIISRPFQAEIQAFANLCAVGNGALFTRLRGVQPPDVLRVFDDGQLRLHTKAVGDGTDFPRGAVRHRPKLFVIVKRNRVEQNVVMDMPLVGVGCHHILVLAAAEFKCQLFAEFVRLLRRDGIPRREGLYQVVGKVC